MVDSSTTRYLTLQQKRAIIIGINLGRRLQQELPPIADDYRARMFILDIVQKYGITSRYSVSRNVAYEAIRHAIRGYGGEFSGIGIDPYMG